MDFCGGFCDCPRYNTQCAALHHAEINREDHSSITIYSGNIVSCSHGDVIELFVLKNYGYQNSDLMEIIRRNVYDNLDIDVSRIVFGGSTTPSDAAQHFAETAYGTHLVDLAPGGIYSVRDYALMDWSVKEISEDKTAVVGECTYV